MGGHEALAHRVAAADGPDAELAAELSAAAAAAADAGQLLLAARYLQQAAAVTGRGPDRDERALSAFELLVRTSDVAAADAARPVIEQLPASARRDTALGQLALLAARPGDAEPLLRAAWDAHDRSARAQRRRGGGSRAGHAAQDVRSARRGRRVAGPRAEQRYRQRAMVRRRALHPVVCLRARR